MIRIAIIIPTYNNAATITEVLTSVLRRHTEIIVINDGSTDGTGLAVKQFTSVTSIDLPVNRGKGEALKKGICAALAQGYTHAITFDADGQHNPDDIPVFIQKIEEQPDTFWIGSRILFDSSTDSPAPYASRFGRAFGSFWFRFNTGIALFDTQCGLRAFNLATVSPLSAKCKGRRYEYEQELLIKVAWKGIALKEVAVRRIYLPKEVAISHFRPVRDFFRISKINAAAAFRRIILPVAFGEIPGKNWQEKLKIVLKREITSHITPSKAAASVTLGVFIGIFPIHGLQMLTLIAVCGLLSYNRPLALLGLCVSSPPLLPLLIVSTVACGRWFLTFDLVKKCTFLYSSNTLWQGTIDFVIGSIILSFVMSLVTYCICWPLFTMISKAYAVTRNSQSSR
ncbi:MAG: DUF2062 domain-containing protein [Chitinivibrionales bacterium]|nr:DUF2062 domain-containing protein [Chitinivibrionales bacterium]